MKYKLIIILAFIIFITACTTSVDLSKDPRVQTKNSVQLAKKINWKDFDLKDLNSGEDFKISDFNKPILVDSFAVWCPSAILQHKKIRELRQIRDDFIAISLDTDPNEDEQKILSYIERQGFDWIYALSPTDLTRSLIEEFGVEIVNAPSAPMILICNGNVKMLKPGVKSVDVLQEELNLCK